MFGQPGNDTLHGDAPDPPSSGDNDGIDVVFGGPGDDNAYGGTGGNIELPDQNFCLVFGNLLFGGPDDDTLRGDYLNWDTNDLEGGIDLIFGASGADTIEGAEGSLIIIGDITTAQAVVIGFGNLLFGGPDNDTIKGANASAVCTGVSGVLDSYLNTAA
jgi:Ca2+-binding RTX toxin-like protein